MISISMKMFIFIQLLICSLTFSWSIIVICWHCCHLLSLHLLSLLSFVVIAFVVIAFVVIVVIVVICWHCCHLLTFVVICCHCICCHCCHLLTLLSFVDICWHCCHIILATIATWLNVILLFRLHKKIKHASCIYVYCILF